jgi:hypothetical protein
MQIQKVKCQLEIFLSKHEKINSLQTITRKKKISIDIWSFKSPVKYFIIKHHYSLFQMIKISVQVLFVI